MRKCLTVLAMAGTATLLMATSATAATTPTPKATGGVSLSGPTQYLSFSAFASTPAKGTVDYTNFEYAFPGSGVWSIDGTSTLTFQLVGDTATYQHSMTVPMSAIVPTSNTSFMFSGTGVYPVPPATAIDPWAVTGHVSGTSVSMVITYLPTAADPGYTVTLTGTIDNTGTMSGTALDSNGFTLDWSSGAGAAHEVLNYILPVTSAAVTQHSATFGYTIPASFFGTALPITMSVFDGGTPGTAGDTVSFAVTGSPLVGYAITGGNLVVH